MERVRVRISDRAHKPKRAGKRSQRLTDANVASLKKADKAFLVWDEPRDCGLAVLVQPSGSKSYYCYFSYGQGQPMRSLQLGKTTALTVEAAREKARDIRKKVAAGFDPRADDPSRSATFARHWLLGIGKNKSGGCATDQLT
jgi:hypothetical protein